MSDQQHSSLYGISLSVEELALVLFSINCPARARQFLRDSYGDLSEEDMSLLLTGARNGLLARNLCTLSASNLPYVPEELERAAFPLQNERATFDVFRVGQAEQRFSQVFLDGQTVFTLHTNQSHIVHTLASGKGALLAPTLASLFAEVGAGKGKPVDLKDTCPASLDLLASLAEMEDGRVEQALLNAGWGKPRAQEMAADIADVLVLGTLAAYQAGKSAPATLFMIQGPERGWLFEFESGSPDRAAHARQVTHKQVLESVTTLVAAAMRPTPEKSA